MVGNGYLQLTRRRTYHVEQNQCFRGSITHSMSLSVLVNTDLILVLIGDASGSGSDETGTIRDRDPMGIVESLKCHVCRIRGYGILKELCYLVHAAHKLMLL